MSYTDDRDEIAEIFGIEPKKKAKQKARDGYSEEIPEPARKAEPEAKAAGRSHHFLHAGKRSHPHQNAVSRHSPLHKRLHNRSQPLPAKPRNLPSRLLFLQPSKRSKRRSQKYQLPRRRKNHSYQKSPSNWLPPPTSSLIRSKRKKQRRRQQGKKRPNQSSKTRKSSFTAITSFLISRRAISSPLRKSPRPPRSP